jgi:hypothetical protein
MESVRDGRKVNIRVGAALFSDPVVLSGTVSADGRSGTWRGNTTLSADHPLNPYKHRYNPEHAAGFDVLRSLTLIVGAESSTPGPTSPIATVGLIRGVYEEVITGLTQEPIRVRGAFRLRRLTGGSVSPCSAGGQ